MTPAFFRGSQPFSKKRQERNLCHFWKKLLKLTFLIFFADFQFLSSNFVQIKSDIILGKVFPLKLCRFPGLGYSQNEITS